MDSARLALAHLLITVVALAPLVGHELSTRLIAPAPGGRAWIKPVFFALVAAVVFVAVRARRSVEAGDSDLGRHAPRLLAAWGAAAVLSWTSGVLAGLYGAWEIAVVGGVVALLALAITRPRSFRR